MTYETTAAENDRRYVGRLNIAIELILDAVEAYKQLNEMHDLHPNHTIEQRIPQSPPHRTEVISQLMEVLLGESLKEGGTTVRVEVLIGQIPNYVLLPGSIGG